MSDAIQYINPQQDTYRDLTEKFNANMALLLSDFASDAFPTENLVQGMKCYRTDEKKLYRLIDLENNTWTVEWDFNLPFDNYLSTESEASLTEASDGVARNKYISPYILKQVLGDAGTGLTFPISLSIKDKDNQYSTVYKKITVEGISSSKVLCLGPLNQDFTYIGEIFLVDSSYCKFVVSVSSGTISSSLLTSKITPKLQVSNNVLYLSDVVGSANGETEIFYHGILSDKVVSAFKLVDAPSDLVNATVASEGYKVGKLISLTDGTELISRRYFETHGGGGGSSVATVNGEEADSNGNIDVHRLIAIDITPTEAIDLNTFTTSGVYMSSAYDTNLVSNAPKEGAFILDIEGGKIGQVYNVKQTIYIQSASNEIPVAVYVRSLNSTDTTAWSPWLNISSGQPLDLLANTSLDSVTDNGKYVCSSAVEAAQIEDLPVTGYPFFLEVTSKTLDNGLIMVTQVFTTVPTTATELPRILTRAGYSTTGVWTNWCEAPQVDAEGNISYPDILTQTTAGMWKPNETLQVGDIRYIPDRKYAGYYLEVVEAGTTGSVFPDPYAEPPAYSELQRPLYLSDLVHPGLIDAKGRTWIWTPTLELLQGYWESYDDTGVIGDVFKTYTGRTFIQLDSENKLREVFGVLEKTSDTLGKASFLAGSSSPSTIWGFVKDDTSNKMISVKYIGGILGAIADFIDGQGNLYNAIEGYQCYVESAGVISGWSWDSEYCVLRNGEQVAMVRIDKTDEVLTVVTFDSTYGKYGVWSADSVQYAPYYSDYIGGSLDGNINSTIPEDDTLGLVYSSSTREKYFDNKLMYDMLTGDSFSLTLDTKNIPEFCQNKTITKAAADALGFLVVSPSLEDSTTKYEPGGVEVPIFYSPVNVFGTFPEVDDNYIYTDRNGVDFIRVDAGYNGLHTAFSYQVAYRGEDYVILHSGNVCKKSDFEDLWTHHLIVKEENPNLEYEGNNSYRDTVTGNLFFYDNEQGEFIDRMSMFYMLGNGLYYDFSQENPYAQGYIKYSPSQGETPSDVEWNPVTFAKVGGKQVYFAGYQDANANNYIARDDAVHPREDFLYRQVNQFTMDNVLKTLYTDDDSQAIFSESGGVWVITPPSTPPATSQDLSSFLFATPVANQYRAITNRIAVTDKAYLQFSSLVDNQVIAPVADTYYQGTAGDVVYAQMEWLTDNVQSDILVRANYFDNTKLYAKPYVYFRDVSQPRDFRADIRDISSLSVASQSNIVSNDYPKWLQYPSSAVVSTVVADVPFTSYTGLLNTVTDDGYQEGMYPTDLSTAGGYTVPVFVIDSINHFVDLELTTGYAVRNTYGLKNQTASFAPSVLQFHHYDGSSFTPIESLDKLKDHSKDYWYLTVDGDIIHVKWNNETSSWDKEVLYIIDHSLFYDGYGADQTGVGAMFSGLYYLGNNSYVAMSTDTTGDYYNDDKHVIALHKKDGSFAGYQAVVQAHRYVAGSTRAYFEIKSIIPTTDSKHYVSFVTEMVENEYLASDGKKYILMFNEDNTFQAIPIQTNTPKQYYGSVTDNDGNVYIPVDNNGSKQYIRVFDLGNYLYRDLQGNLWARQFASNYDSTNFIFVRVKETSTGDDEFSLALDLEEDV